MITLPEQREARRVSPHHIDPDGHDFFALIDTYLDSEDQARVRDAFELARLEHGNQRRRSGELFFTHPLTVSYYLAEYRLDAAALMAALLHDIAEDTLVSIQQIRDLFGAEVSYLVDGVTNLKEVSAGIARDRLLTPDEIQDASLHKMFDAMTADVRVVLVKLFDRLHNMRTIQALPINTQIRKANETLLVYAPLANRLGIWHLKGELEGLCLQVLDADAYSAVHQALEGASRRHQSAYLSVTQEITQHLNENDLVVANVLPSPESEYSVYLALSAVGAPYSGLESPLRVVVLLDDVPSCYLALGYLHQKWRPVPGTFDDYIASPRENLYRALHTRAGR
jgi:GTP pyrophosphokinase